jgi:hypothetical protein
MKMVKSLLLVSAAGFVAVPGAQAADLPVKAKPVEYVKVCSLYGAGFYYIPGTDICMKIGGYVRYQVNVNAGSSNSFGPFSGIGGYNNRVTNGDVAQRARAVLTWDTRQQTAYGTLRTYFLIGLSQDTNGGGGAVGLYATRAFIQIAGFTFGKATSFFDFVASAAVAYNAGYTHSPDTGDPGRLVAAYTAQFGNGVSGTISMEESRRNPTVYTSAGSFPVGGAPASNNLGAGSTAGPASLPDVVANLRVDQTWGSAQVSAAVHDVSAAYYGAGVLATLNEANGHPSNKVGWAASAGLRVNAPMIAAGDYFQGMVVYSEGAIRYASFSPAGGGIQHRWDGSTVGFGYYEDAVFGGTIPAGTATSVELTTAWSAFASFEHFWTPSLRTSIYGSYIDVSHNATATALICAVLPGGPVGCNPDFQSWNVGSRTQWDITKDFLVGVDVIYVKLESVVLGAGAPVAIVLPSTSGKPTGPYTTSDQDAWAVTWRIQRSFVP